MGNGRLSFGPGWFQRLYQKMGVLWAVVSNWVTARSRFCRSTPPKHILWYPYITSVHPQGPKAVTIRTILFFGVGNPKLKCLPLAFLGGKGGGRSNLLLHLACFFSESPWGYGPVTVESQDCLLCNHLVICPCYLGWWNNGGWRIHFWDCGC